MKILILSQTFPFGKANGVQGHFILDLAESLSALGHKVIVQVPFHKNLKVTEFKNITVVPFKYIWPDGLHKIGFGQTLEDDTNLKWFIYLLFPFYFFFSLLNFLKIIRKERPDIVNAHWLIPTGLIAVIAKKISPFPLMIQTHGSDVYLKRHSSLFNFLRNYTISNCNLLTAVSPTLLADLERPGAVILLPIQRIKGKKMPNKKLLVASAGRDTPSKGFGYIKKACPDLEVISGLPHAKFQQKLLSVDIFIAPFSQNPTGNTDDPTIVAFEAMSAGCAVIAPDLPGYRMIIRNKIDGLLVDPHNLESLKKALRELETNKKLRQRISKSGRARVNSLLAPKKVAENYLKFFEKLVFPKSK